MAAFIIASCTQSTSTIPATLASLPTVTQIPTPDRVPTVIAATDTPLPPAPTATSATAPTPTPTSAAQVEPRIFIASERTNSIQVWQGEPPRFVTMIPVGRYPHNLSVSNNARWVAAANRWSNDISIVDTATLTETHRIRVGVAPHDLSWSPDDKRLYVTQEKEFFITVIDAENWTALDPIRVDSPQHDLAIAPDGREMWLTTIQYRGLLFVDLQKNEMVGQLRYFPHGSHDITFRPDVDEVWVTSSGFIRGPADTDPTIVIFDRASRQIKANQPFGQYPFHSVKKFRDGLFLPPNSETVWFSDRGLGGVIEVNVARREVVAEVKTGRAPFHLTFGPNGLLYVANHDDATFCVIDPQQHIVLHTVNVAPDPHGIVVIVAPP